MAKKVREQRQTKAQSQRLPGLRVKADDTEPEVLAAAIVETAKAARRLLGSKLNNRAVLVLINNACKVPQGDIELVLNAAATLDTTFLKK